MTYERLGWLTTAVNIGRQVAPVAADLYKRLDEIEKQKSEAGSAAAMAALQSEENRIRAEIAALTGGKQAQYRREELVKVAALGVVGAVVLILTSLK